MTFTIANVNVNGIRAACKQRNENNPGMKVWLEETTVVPQLWTELDGVEKLGNVIVIGATNREELIDPAIMRPACWGGSHES